MGDMRSPHRTYDTASIANLRVALKRFATMNPSIVQFANFRLVVDANFAMGAVISKARFPERGKTALEELVTSTVVDAHAPRWLDIEMTAKIPRVASRSRIAEESMQLAWREYRGIVRFDEALATAPLACEAGRDPKDIPYVELEKKIDAHGILSSDRDITALGGHALDLAFALLLRRYARSVAETGTLQLAGYTAGTLAMMGTAKAGRAIARSLASLPPAIKMLLIGSATIAVIHPASRKYILEFFAAMGDRIAAFAPDILAFVGDLSRQNAVARAHADELLAVVSSMVKQPQ
jgi:predicted nucleic acid-binding protein